MTPSSDHTFLREIPCMTKRTLRMKFKVMIIGETLFKLTFDKERVIPVEVRLSSLRRAHYGESSNNEELRLNLDCLSEVRDKAALRMA